MVDNLVGAHGEIFLQLREERLYLTLVHVAYATDEIFFHQQNAADYIIYVCFWNVGMSLLNGEALCQKVSTDKADVLFEISSFHKA